MRRFSVLLGSTAPASAAALTAFFAGLGLGSFLLGRLAPRLARPLLAFAALETATAISALSVEPLLHAMEPLLGLLYDTSADGAALLTALRFGIAIVAVLVPATCMGGTLPVLAHVAGSQELLGVRAGGLYAVNTFGAAVGAVAVPAVLLARFGADGALTVIVTINLLVAIGAIWLGRKRPRPAARSARANRTGAFEASSGASAGFLWLAFLSGAITLGLEALAARAFALVHENSVYSFATVVAVFLAGLAAGAALSRVLLRRAASPRAIVAIGWALAALWIIWLPAMFVGVTGLDYLQGGRLSAHEVRLAALAAVTLLTPTVLLGLALPALMQAYGGGGGAGPAIGAILAANTAGAIAGPLLATFVLAPAVGLWNAIAVLGLLSITAAALVATRARPVRLTLAVCAAAMAAALFVAPPGRLPRIKLAPSEYLLDFREGAFGTVAVVARDGQRRLKLNNFYVLGGTQAAATERLQGHIPLLLHARPQRVVFMGIGTGISLSAVRFHPVRDAVALELVPDVIAAARAWFGEANLEVLNDPRIRVRAEDARSFLGATRDRFDVVIGDLVVPWRRGEAALYTRESFAAARRVLAPGGLFCQWVPLYQLSEAEFDSIATSFLDVFPRATLWRGDFSAGEPAVALVGHTGPFDPSAVDARMRALAAAPDRRNPYLSHPAGLWMYFVGPLEPADPRFRTAPRNRDAFPWVELASPRLHLGIERGDESAFVGRPLQARLDALRALPLDDTAAAALRPEHLEWRDRGAEVWHASLLSFEGDNAAADRLGMSALSRLPDEIQLAVLGRRASP